MIHLLFLHKSFRNAKKEDDVDPIFIFFKSIFEYFFKNFNIKSREQF